MRKDSIMRYLGGLRGSGTVTCGDRSVAGVDYDFDGFLTGPGEVTANGEIRMPADAMREAFAQRDVLLQTDDGRKLKLRFSEKKLDPDCDAAHVDVTGDLPAQSDW
ncbi:MAG: hypothetical protein Kilf2KO_13540 [Rhodospirillales bacterium]